MIKQIEAIYENGMLKPLEALPLAEHQHVRVTVSEISGDPLASMIDLPFLEHARHEIAAAHYVPTNRGSATNDGEGSEFLGGHNHR